MKYILLLISVIGVCGGVIFYVLFVTCSAKNLRLGKEIRRAIYNLCEKGRRNE